MESSRRIQRVSLRQLEILWEFLNSNKDIATAHNRALQAKEFAKRKWGEISEILNSQGDGAHKDWAGWSKYWVDYKAKLKKRVAILRTSRVQTGGEDWCRPSTEKALTKIEEKFLIILGEDFGQGLPGVRVEPPPELITSAMDVGVQGSESLIQSQPFLTPIQNRSVEPLDSLPQNSQDMVQDPPARSPSITPTQSPRPATTSAARSSRRRRQRLEPPMSQEAARRALVRSSQIHAEAALRTAIAMENGVKILEQLQKSARRIERFLCAASPTVAEPDDS